MPRDLVKTLTYLSIHLLVGFGVAYALTGSVKIAGGIALIEPMINAVAFYFHEKAWKRFDRKRSASDASDAPPPESDMRVFHPTLHLPAYMRRRGPRGG